jgi:lambda repressor-like predicted transcriptional regulator
METNEIKAAMILQGVTTKQIAEGLGITAQAIGPVISGRRSNPRIRAAIAEALGRSVEEIWPVPTGKEAA